MKVFKLLVFVFLSLAIVSCNSKYQTKKLDSKLDSVSYALGVDVALKIKNNLGKIDSDLFFQGYLNSMDSLDLLLKPQDLKIITAYAKEKRIEAIRIQQQKERAAAEKKFGAIKKAGEEFLAKNKTKKGVKTTASGLQYIVLKQGKGDKPLATSRVKVHYHGTLIDGTVFDSSVEKKIPYVTNVNRVIKGWIEGLQLMNVGSKYKFFIPQELAYGATPRSGVIKPFMPLIFEIELLEIVKK